MRFEDINGMKVAIYLRKSQKDTDREKMYDLNMSDEETLERHRKELFAFASEYNLKFHPTEDVYMEVVSGEHIYQRPRMVELLKKIKKSVYRGVLVLDLDRLTRGDKIDQGAIEGALKDSETIVITPSGIFDLSNEADAFAVSIRMYFANIELKQIASRLQAGRMRSTVDGRDMAPKPPYGYSKNEDLSLVRNEEEATVVRDIFDQFVSGKKISDISKDLSLRGILSPSGKQKWSYQTITRILRREKYVGHQMFGIRQTKKGENGKYIEKRTRNKNKIVKSHNKHEALVDHEVWIKAQDILDDLSRSHLDKRFSNPLKDLFNCTRCKGKMYLTRRTNQPSIFYCRTVGCDAPRIEEQEVMEHISKYAYNNLIFKRREMWEGEDVGNQIEDLEDLKEIMEKEGCYKEKNEIIKLLIKEVQYKKKAGWQKNGFKIEIISY